MKNVDLFVAGATVAGEASRHGSNTAAKHRANVIGVCEMTKKCTTLAAFALITMLAAPAAAQNPGGWTQVGVLNCRVNPSIGFIIAGHQSMQCLFTQSAPIPPQAYEGALNMVGLNVGISAGGVLAWAVYAPTAGSAAGALAGEYIGASGDIGLGVGVGANVLVGGSGRTIALLAIPLRQSGPICCSSCIRHRRQ